MTELKALQMKKSEIETEIRQLEKQAENST